MTLQEAFDNFILSRQLADLSPKTITAYRDFVSPFIAALSPDKPFLDIQQSDIQQYLLTLLKKPLSKSTRATYIRHVKIFLRWAQNEYTASYDAKKIKVPKSPKREVRIYTESEVNAIFSSITAESDWLVFRNKCIIALMYDSGLRRAEVCTLRRSKISYADNRMVVRGKGDKERTVPLGSLTAYFMKEYIASCPYSSDALFVNRRGEPLTGNAVKLMVSKLADKLPFELSSHKLRHNFATNYCIDQYEHNRQVDIYRLMYLMGHEDVETTQRYLHFAYEIIASRDSISHLDKLNLVNGDIKS